MLRTIFFYPCIIISLIYASISYKIKTSFLCKKMNEKEKQIYIHKFTYNWSRFILKIAGAKVTVEGIDNIPNDKTILFVSNHQSNFDIPVLIGNIDVPKGFIAKKELESWPFISTWMKHIHCIFMDRSNMRKSAEAIVDGIKLLRSGYSMVVFPEGTRSKGGDIAEFKAGSFKLAIKSKCIIVPITINGTHKLLEANNNKIKSANIKLVIHDPIDVSTLPKEEINTLHETVKSIINKSYIRNK